MYRCIFVYLSIYLSIYLCIYLSIYLYSYGLLGLFWQPTGPQLGLLWGIGGVLRRLRDKFPPVSGFVLYMYIFMHSECIQRRIRAHREYLHALGSPHAGNCQLGCACLTDLICIWSLRWVFRSRAVPSLGKGTPSDPRLRPS